MNIELILNNDLLVDKMQIVQPTVNQPMTSYSQALQKNNSNLF